MKLNADWKADITVAENSIRRCYSKLAGRLHGASVLGDPEAEALERDLTRGVKVVQSVIERLNKLYDAQQAAS